MNFEYYKEPLKGECRTLKSLSNLIKGEIKEKVYSTEWFLLNIGWLEKLYYKSGIASSSFTIPYDKRTPRNVEERAETYEISGTIDNWIVAWKLGRIDEQGNIVLNADGSIRNTYGRKIYGLDDYLKKIDIGGIKSEIEQGRFQKAFHSMAAISPNNFDTVYIITLMHFISKGEIPIYDKFAHIAVKALYANVRPSEIYVGPAPDKNDLPGVYNLMNEYMWLLNKVFGTSKISKSIYRALWAYGHENGKKEDVHFLWQ